MKMTAPSRLDALKEPLSDEQVQTAALCVRPGPDGLEVLLVSSLQTRRWILPKGWPITGRSIAASALQEAWEEAGVTGGVHEHSIGSYGYCKIRKDGSAVPCRVAVFRVDVEALADSYPEQSKRDRRWMRPAEAADLVQEPELQALLRAL